MINRAHFLFAIMAVALLLPAVVNAAFAESPDLVWQRCKQFAPAESIVGCTALIDAGTQASAFGVADAYRYRGIAYLRGGDFNRARIDEEQSARLNPQEQTPIFYHGLALYGLGDLPNALADFNLVISHDPRFAEAIYARGMTERRLGDAKSADADFAAAVALGGDVTKTIADLGFQP